MSDSGVTQSPDDVTLCCLLWAREGMIDALREYEDDVTDLLGDYAATLLTRVSGAGAGGTPHEVQIYRFPNQAAVHSFIADPRRAAWSSRRDAAIARTETFAVSLVEPPAR